jgi:putative SOS response-associated peptidase YedK
MKGGRPFVLAGLLEGWKPPEAEDWIRTYTIITGEPNELIREIHTRMPVILSAHSYTRGGGKFITDWITSQ